MCVELEIPISYCKQQPPIRRKSLHPYRTSTTNWFIPIEPKNYSGTCLAGISHLSRWLKELRIALNSLQKRESGILRSVPGGQENPAGTHFLLNLRETWDLSKRVGTRSPSLNQNIRGVKHWADTFRDLIPAPQALFFWHWDESGKLCLYLRVWMDWSHTLCSADVHPSGLTYPPTTSPALKQRRNQNIGKEDC